MVDAEDSKSSLGNKVLVRVRSSVMFETYFGKKKLVCFDFDGLLVNTEPVHHRAYNEVLELLQAPLHLTFSEYCRLAHSENRHLFEQTVKQNFPDFPYSWEQVRKKKIALYSSLIQSQPVPVMEGACELITKLFENGRDVCIVTNSFRADVDTIRGHLPVIKSIPLVFARENYSLPKPSPDGYLKALEHHNYLAKDAIGLEDSIKGITALKDAGMDYLFINSSHPHSTHSSLKEFL